MDAGFIKLHRKITKWEWYTDANTVRLFFHLLLNANYRASKYQGQEVPEGGVVTGHSSLAAELKLSVQQIRTAIKRLKSTGEITVKTTSKFSIISMVNWNEYQEDNRQPNSQLTVDQQASNSHLTTSKEGKKERRKERKKV